MYSELFEELGLTPNEAKIYEVLVSSTQERGVSAIATKAGIHRRNIYDALTRLLDKGLIFQIVQRGEHVYRAVHPNKLLEALKEREQKLQNVLPALSKLYETDPPHEAAFIYRGIEGYKNYRRDLLQTNEEVFFLGAKALWLTPGIPKSFHEDFKKQSKKKKLSFKTLFDPRIPKELPLALQSIGGEFKVLPDGYETIGVVDIFEDRIVTFTSEGVGNFGENGSIFVMINRDLAESYKQWFRFIWEHTPEYRHT